MLGMLLMVGPAAAMTWAGDDWPTFRGPTQPAMPILAQFGHDTLASPNAPRAEVQAEVAHSSRVGNLVDEHSVAVRHRLDQTSCGLRIIPGHIDGIFFDQ